MTLSPIHTLITSEQKLTQRLREIGRYFQNMSALKLGSVIAAHADVANAGFRYWQQQSYSGLYFIHKVNLSS